MEATTLAPPTTTVNHRVKLARAKIITNIKNAIGKEILLKEIDWERNQEKKATGKNGNSLLVADVEIRQILSDVKDYIDNTISRPLDHTKNKLLNRFVKGVDVAYKTQYNLAALKKLLKLLKNAEKENKTGEQNTTKQKKSRPRLNILYRDGAILPTRAIAAGDIHLYHWEVKSTDQPWFQIKEKTEVAPEMSEGFVRLVYNGVLYSNAINIRTVINRQVHHLKRKPHKFSVSDSEFQRRCYRVAERIAGLYTPHAGQSSGLSMRVFQDRVSRLPEYMTSDKTMNVQDILHLCQHIFSRSGDSDEDSKFVHMVEFCEPTIRLNPASLTRKLKQIYSGHKIILTLDTGNGSERQPETDSSEEDVASSSEEEDEFANFERIAEEQEDARDAQWTQEVAVEPTIDPQNNLQEELDIIENAFNFFDSNGDGSITLEEFRIQWPDMKENVRAHLIKENDLNHDGSITLDEWTKWCLETDAVQNWQMSELSLGDSQEETKELTKEAENAARLAQKNAEFLKIIQPKKQSFGLQTDENVARLAQKNSAFSKLIEPPDDNETDDDDYSSDEGNLIGLVVGETKENDDLAAPTTPNTGTRASSPDAPTVDNEEEEFTKFEQISEQQQQLQEAQRAQEALDGVKKTRVKVINGKYKNETGTITKRTAFKFQLKLDSGKMTDSGILPMVKHDQVEYIDSDSDENDNDNDREDLTNTEASELVEPTDDNETDSDDDRTNGVVTSSSVKVMKVKTMKNYRTVGGGTTSAAIHSFFTANGNVYHKSSRRTSKKTTLEKAMENGWILAKDENQSETKSKASTSSTDYSSDEGIELVVGETKENDDLAAPTTPPVLKKTRVKVINGKYKNETGTITKHTAFKFQLKLDSGKMTDSGKLPMVKHDQVEYLDSDSDENDNDNEQKDLTNTEVTDDDEFESKHEWRQMETPPINGDIVRINGLVGPVEVRGGGHYRVYREDGTFEKSHGLNPMERPIDVKQTYKPTTSAQSVPSGELTAMLTNMSSDWATSDDELNFAEDSANEFEEEAMVFAETSSGHDTNEMVFAETSSGHDTNEMVFAGSSESMSSALEFAESSDFAMTSDSDTGQ
jgi:hypothetical protein